MVTIRPVQCAKTQCLTAPDDPRQICSPITNQIGADVVRSVVRHAVTVRLSGQIESSLGDLIFRQTRSPVQILNCPAASIARIEIQPGIDACRILSQQCFHTAQLFEADFPVNQVQLAKAGERVPDGQLIIRLAV